MKRTVRLLPVLIICALFFSCQSNTPEYIISTFDYLERYNTLASSYGFKNASLTAENNNVCGFAAFDGLFIVCFETDGNGNIYVAQISTGSSYADTLVDSAKFDEALIFASCVISPFVYGNAVPQDTELSETAGVIFESFGGPLPLSDNTVIVSHKTGDGGFSISVTSTALAE